MSTVETTVWINSPLERVYAIAKDNRAFPEFMDDVQSVSIVESESGRVVSDWVGIISAFGIKVRWTQEDIWDDAQFTCHFRQIKGDYDEMDGTWTFKEENGGTRFESVMSYEYIVPGLGPLIKKVVHSLVTKNLDGVLAAIKKRAEKP